MLQSAVVNEPTPGHAGPLGPRPSDSLRAELMRQRVHARMFGEPGPPTQIGRFRVSEAIGRGGMGTVYLAWDETLDRAVALKFLHRRDSEALVVEAQALARLAHPNVIAVFDVGVHEGRVWLAMEHVRGQTLRSWQRGSASRSERLAAWLAAGHGLAAVHAAGLIHRDVKPDNVLRGDDGRVRLIDFGLVLARSSGSITARSGQPDATESEGGVGTADYAAPEQWSGAAIDARADQYAYCVSVWEALAGERPPRDERGTLLVAQLPGVSRRISDALVRGLAPTPDRRWPSMAALLARLEPRRHRGELALVVVLAAGLGLGLGLAGRDAPRALDVCANAGASLDVDAAAVLEPGPLRSAAEQWIREWRAAAEQACRAQRLAPTRFDPRLRCLERQRRAFSAALEHLAAVRAGEESLHSRRLELADPGACLRAPLPSQTAPPEQWVAITELERALVELERSTAEQGRTLIPAGEKLLAHARASAWPPIIAEAALVLARIHIRAGEGEPARELLGEALDLAMQHERDELVLRAWSTLVELEIDLALDPEAASWAWQRESAAIAQLGPSELERGVLAGQAAAIASLRGDLGTSEAELREAVAAYERAGFAGHLRLASALDRLALVVGAGGREREQLELQQRARAAERELDASEMPSVDHASEADRAFDRASLALLAGDHGEAIEQLQVALAGYARSSGSESPQVAQTHVALAQVYDAIGSLDAAEQHANEADAICLARLGPAHPLRSATLSALGTLALRRGDPAASLAAFRLALRIEQTRPGGGGVDLALARSNLAEALLAAGEADEARTHAEMALSELTSALPPEHPDLAYAHKALGWALLELGDLAGARRHLRSALALPSWSDVETREIAALLARADAAPG